MIRNRCLESYLLEHIPKLLLRLDAHMLNDVARRRGLVDVGKRALCYLVDGFDLLMA